MRIKWNFDDAWRWYLSGAILLGEMIGFIGYLLWTVTR